MKFHCIAFTSAALALAGPCFATSPEQEGVWVGSLKTKSHFSTGTASIKQEMRLDVGPSNATTVTLDGVVQFSGGSAFDGSEGIFIYIDPNALPATRFGYGAVHFKGTKIKGTTSGFAIVTTPALQETFNGKISLKKQP